MAYVLDGKILEEGKGFIHPDGRAFSKNFLTHAPEELLLEVGIRWMPDPKRDPDLEWDKRFWWGPDRPRNLKKIKEKYKDKYSLHALKILSRSDWIVIRAKEIGRPVPRDWFDFRQEVRSVCNGRQKDLDKAKDMNEVQQMVSQPTRPWPTSPDEPKPEQLEDENP